MFSEQSRILTVKDFSEIKKGLLESNPNWRQNRNYPIANLIIAYYTDLSRGKQKTKVSVITMMDGSVYAIHNDILFAMDINPERQKISEQIDFDMDIPVVRKKYIPPFDSIWRITNSNLFRKKALIF